MIDIKDIKVGDMVKIHSRVLRDEGLFILNGQWLSVSHVYKKEGGHIGVSASDGRAFVYSIEDVCSHKSKEDFKEGNYDIIDDVTYADSEKPQGEPLHTTDEPTEYEYGFHEGDSVRMDEELASKAKASSLVHYKVVQAGLTYITIDTGYGYAYIEQSDYHHLTKVDVPSNTSDEQASYEVAYIAEAPKSALQSEVGGSHYKDMKIQPIEFAMANNFNACQTLILKYISRYKNKNGKEDLEKAKHCIDLLIGFEYGNKE